MRLLVPGGPGYSGSHPVRLFLDHGHDVWVYDSLVFGHRQAVPAERLVVADLADTHRLDQLLVEKKFDGVVHFAAFAYVGEAGTHPAKDYRHNVMNSLRPLQAGRKDQVPPVLVFPTRGTFPMPQSLP